MREIYVHEDYSRVGLCKSVLDEAGIPNIIRNGPSYNLTSPLFHPSLCVVNDEDYAAAMELVNGILDESPIPAPDWRCPRCDEEVPGSFEFCWHCNFERNRVTP